jgi:hypothetical protein
MLYSYHIVLFVGGSSVVVVVVVVVDDGRMEGASILNELRQRKENSFVCEVYPPA